MTTSVEVEIPSVPPGRWQISLADLIVLVLAVGVSAGFARAAREAVGYRVLAGRSSPGGAATPATSWPVPLERTAGLVFEVTAVFLFVVLVRTIMGLIRTARQRDGVRTAAFVWSIAWRVAAAAFLWGFVADQSSVLRIDFASESQLTAARPGWGANYRLRQGLLPVCGALAMVGLALGMGAGAIFDESLPRRWRPSWLFVPLAGLIAVLLVVESDYSLIAYLHVIAVEAVSIAMPHASRPGPDLTARLLGGGLDAVVAVMCCTALGLVVAHDFERARRAEPWATTRAGRALRLFLLLATLGAGTYLTTVTIPRIQPALSEGLSQVLNPGVVFWMLAGFGLFGMGLATRALVPRSSSREPAWLIWLSRLLRYGFMALLLVSALKHLPAAAQLPPGTPPSVGRVVDVVGAAQARAWGLLPYPVVVVLIYCLEPDQLRWLITVVFVVPLVVEQVVRRASAAEAPFDAAFGTARSVMQVSWLTVALVVLCVAALPTLTVAGLSGLHIRLNVMDWMTQRAL
jgi:hypothetical protein